MNKPIFMPLAQWRQQFEFKPIYDYVPPVHEFEPTLPNLPFVADPVLAYWSTQKTGPGPV